MQEYIKTDRILHWLSQVLTKVNRTFVPEEEDDSHTNLHFDVLGSRIYGRWISTPSGKIIFYLDLESLSFRWMDQKRTILHEKSVLNAGLKDLEGDAGAFLAKLGKNTEGLEDPLHFELPDYGIKRLSQEDITLSGLQSWEYYRELANMASFGMLCYLQEESEIRIWPHHFDTGIYTQITEQLGIGFGLAMEDPMVGEPYFYLSAYAGDSTINYSRLNDLSSGRWETQASWKGAVLPLSDLPASSKPEALKVIGRFIKEATSWYFKPED